MAISLFDELPAEIRLYIFRLATIKASQHEDTHADYRPFEAVAMHDRDWSSSTQQALDVKRTVVLVSKEWKKIATEMLYECIRVGHGTQALIDALEGPLSESEQASEDGENELRLKTFDNGRWVRRIEISPAILDFDPFNPLPLLRILKSCPGVEVVVRPCTALMGGPGLGNVSRALDPDGGASIPTFPSVKRIDWWLPCSMPSNRMFESELGLQGFLGDLVAHSPNLQYLTLAGFHDWMTPYRRQLSVPVFVKEYPSITTFRLEGEDWRVPSIDVDLVFPNLERLVMGITKTPADWILERNGHLVKVLEFVDVGFPSHAKASERSKAWSTKNVFAACRNIRELCVSLDMGSSLALENESVVLNALKCIRIKLEGNCSQEKGLAFGVFFKYRLVCPALERIVLCAVCGKEEEWRETDIYLLLTHYVAQLKYVTLEFDSF